MVRADRLLNIMILLQNRGKITAGDLAYELEVSKRTIFRDMDALSSAGVPIISDRGKDGGWRLLDNFRNQLSGMKKEDIQTLFIFPSGEQLNDLGLNPQSLDTREKLLASIPEGYRDEAQRIRERIYIDTSTWRQSKEKIDSFKIVQRAVWDNKKLLILYENTEGVQSERYIEPLGLVAKGNKWYLVASTEEGMRIFRVSRIQSATIKSETFKRPANFNLAAYWIQSKSRFIQNLPQYQVHVELSPDIINRLHFTGHFVRVINTQPPNSNKWTPAILSFHHEQEAIEYILGFGDKIKIVTPDDLTEKVLSKAQSVIHFQGQV